MNTTQRTGIMQRWNIIQHELMPELRNEVGALTPKLMQVVHTLEWVRIEEFVNSSWSGCGRPEHDRGLLASAYVAKAVLGISTTAGLIERLAVDRAFRRICGFSMWKKLPSEATFSRAFAEFAEAGLAERTHAALVKETLADVKAAWQIDFTPGTIVVDDRGYNDYPLGAVRKGVGFLASDPCQPP